MPAVDDIGWRVTRIVFVFDANARARRTQHFVRYEQSHLGQIRTWRERAMHVSRSCYYHRLCCVHRCRVVCVLLMLVFFCIMFASKQRYID